MWNNKERPELVKRAIYTRRNEVAIHESRATINRVLAAINLGAAVMEGSIVLQNVVEHKGGLNLFVSVGLTGLSSGVSAYTFSRAASESRTAETFRAQQLQLEDAVLLQQTHVSSNESL
ncbi:hypothetical protein H0V99_00345 [Candidatus Saccharibacteria bacterium]|nr:hypothetical protein [Candidatus Saccharibacteria bacterium]